MRAEAGWASVAGCWPGAAGRHKWAGAAVLALPCLERCLPVVDDRAGGASGQGTLQGGHAGGCGPVWAVHAAAAS